MSANSSIEWTDRTWNPVRGCSVVSPGCVNCYAMKQAHRFGGPGRAYEGLTKLTSAGPQWTGIVRPVESALREPLSWRAPQRVFVNSMSDLFHEDVPDAFIDQVFAVMALAPRHTFQILTKRAERMHAYLSRACGRIADAVQPLRTDANRVVVPLPHGEPGRQWWPLPNVWLGVSVEDQKHADERIPQLLQTPAAVRFLSYEPALGPVDLTNYLWTIPGARLNRLHWIIVGGESGPGARPFDVAWARWIVAQGRSSGVSVFIKQLGASPRQSVMYGPATFEADQPVHLEALSLKNRKGGDMAEWPADLRIREFPR